MMQAKAPRISSKHSPPGIRVTEHAIRRYLERVENCTRAEAVDRISHALEISVPATARHLDQLNGRRGKKLKPCSGRMYRWCEVASLVLVVVVVPRAMLVLTLVPLEAN